MAPDIAGRPHAARQGLDQRQAGLGGGARVARTRRLQLDNPRLDGL
jgi:hypothetical protein